MSEQRMPEPGMPESPIPESRDDRITLTGLRVRGHHGVYEDERRDGQDFVVDLTVWLDLRAAARTDALADTLDYARLASLAARVVGGPPYDLVEVVADRIAAQVLASDSRLAAVEVTVHKPSAPIPQHVHDIAVTLLRRRHPEGEQ